MSPDTDLSTATTRGARDEPPFLLAGRLELAGAREDRSPGFFIEFRAPRNWDCVFATILEHIPEGEGVAPSLREIKNEQYRPQVDAALRRLGRDMPRSAMICTNLGIIASRVRRPILPSR